MHADRPRALAESFRDEVGSGEVAALLVDGDLGVGHGVSELLAMLGHEHVGQAVIDAGRDADLRHVEARVGSKQKMSSTLPQTP